MDCPKTLGDHSGKRELVHLAPWPGFRVADAKCLSPFDERGHRADYGAGIQASTQEDPERHIADQMHPYGLVQPAAELLDGVPC